jgi:hypothetical protein
VKQLRRFVPAAVAATIVAAAACGGNGTGPAPQAASVTGIAGDSQTAPTGGPLAFPLSFTALGSNGQPVQGVHVTWTSTPANGVTFVPVSAVSDVNGIVSTNVRAGATPDTVLIQAQVPGVQQPVAFHVIVFDPCRTAVLHTLGTSVNGTLTTFDCKLGTTFKYYYDFYGLSLSTQTGVTINMSANFDTYLDVYKDLSTQLDYVGYQDDISPTNLNSRFQAILAPGQYIIGANSADTLVTGPYTLASAARPQTIDNCEEVWVNRGVVINDNISTTDCPDATGGGSYGDSVKILVAAGSVLKIAERSSTVNPKLMLFHIIFRVGADSAELVAWNDDSAATTTNAYIAYTVPPSGAQLQQLVIFAGTNATGLTGAYTLDISSATTLSSRASPPVAGREWRGVLGLPKRSKH